MCAHRIMHLDCGQHPPAPQRDTRRCRSSLCNQLTCNASGSARASARLICVPRGGRRKQLRPCTLHDGTRTFCVGDSMTQLMRLNARSTKRQCTWCARPTDCEHVSSHVLKDRATSERCCLLLDLRDEGRRHSSKSRSRRSTSAHWWTSVVPKPPASCMYV